jgi:hypothetical protein
MNSKSLILISIFFNLISTNVFSSIKSSEKLSSIKPAKHLLKKTNQKMFLEKLFIENNKSKKLQDKIKEIVLKNPKNSVVTLIDVMKNKKYPDHMRWLATNLLARIMGKKSSRFIGKFTEHPEWFMRMASLKALLSLKDKSQSSVYVKRLKDSSMLVKFQALENIRELKIKNLSNNVFKMLLDKKNYSSKKGKLVRNDLIKKVITSLGDLGHTPSAKLFAKMIQDKSFNDIFGELNYSLEKITGKTISFKNNKEKTRKHWSKLLKI